jgi:hypothetical protein
MMKRIPTISLALVVSLVIISLTLAQTGGGYDLTWNSIDGGYMFSTGGGYSLAGTIGQPDVGALSGGGYTLAGGFWAGTDIQYKVYLPIVLK